MTKAELDALLVYIERRVELAVTMRGTADNKEYLGRRLADLEQAKRYLYDVLCPTKPVVIKSHEC